MKKTLIAVATVCALLGGVWTAYACCGAEEPSVSTDVLWPPNHKMVDVQVVFSIMGQPQPQVDPWGYQIWSIASVEAIDGTGGDGNTDPDSEIKGDVVALRSERSGKNKEGRQYVINIQSIYGPTSTTVLVPHDMRDKQGS